ncbi:molybdate ABC transporter permease subunit [bacterium]|nr:molybdate ABC transporter permease subunit [bacterium]
MDSSLLFSLRLSFQVAVIATLFLLPVGIFVAYILAMKSFKGKDVVDTFLTLPLVLPPTVTGYYLVVILGRNGLLGKPLYEATGISIMFTWYAAVFASFFVALPIMIKTTKAAFESVDKNIINASYTLGHSEWETALKVVIPLAGKGIVAATVLAFARALGEFGATLMFAGNIPGRTNTMPLAIYTAMTSGEYTKAHIMAGMFTLISGVCLYLANKLGRGSLR